MASLNDEHFRAQLEGLARLHESEHERNLARSAFMWLCVAQRPLRAHELWIAIRVQESEDIDSLLTKSVYTDDKKAASSLQNLLGSLVSLSPDPEDSSKLYVSLQKAEFKAFFSQSGSKHVPPSWRTLAFTSSDAHIAAGRVCMTICSSTALRLSHTSDQSIASGLVLYACENWHTHLCLSNLSLADVSIASLVDTMIFEVATDILVFLLSLSNFITGPITLPATENKTETTALVKRIQDVLDQPIVLLSSVVRHEEYSRSLHSARQAFESWRNLTTHDAQESPHNSSTKSMKGMAAPDLPTTSRSTAKSLQMEYLQIENLFQATEFIFAQSERHTIQSFTEISRGLRTLAVALRQQPIYDEILKQHAAPWCPLDILVYGANWMEAVASYPYWKTLQDGHPAVSGAGIVNYNQADQIFSPRQKEGTERPRVTLPPCSALKVDVSWPRWQAALLLDKLKSFPKRPTFTINGLRSNNSRRSSFEEIPPGLQALDSPLRYTPPFISRFLYHFRSRGAVPFLTASSQKPRDELNSPGLTLSLAQNWPLVKSSIIADGYRTAVAYFGFAILLHQIRRTLLPWLGTYMWFTPLEDMRLALSNPDYFLDAALSFSWTWCILMHGQKYACDLLAGFAIRLLVADNGRETSSLAPSPYLERLREACRVGYLFWVCVTIEYVLCRSIQTISFGLAYWKLFSGGDVQHIVLGNILKAHWAKLLLNGWQLLYYAQNGLLPLTKASVLCALQGQPGLLFLVLAIVGAVRAILKYRSTVFIALEVSGLVIAIGLAVLSVVLLATELVNDPLGLKASTAKMRRRESRVRRELPPGASARVIILDRKAPSRVSRTLPMPDLTEGKTSGTHGIKED